MMLILSFKYHFQPILGFDRTVSLLKEEYDYKNMKATKKSNFKNMCSLGILPVFHDFINPACP